MGEVTTPVERRERTRRRNRAIAVASGIVVATAAVVVGLAVAGGGGDDSKTSSPTPVTVRRGNSVALPLGDVSADSAGAGVTVTPEQSQQVINVLSDYVNGAIVQP